MTSGRNLARGFLTVTGARMLGLVLTLVQVKLVVSHLGPTTYGLLITATLFIQSLGAWTELGVGAVVVRRVSGQGADLQRTVGLSMAISALIIAPLMLGANVGGAFLYHGQPSVVLGIAILSVGLVFQTWATCYNPVAQVTGRFGRYAAADIVGRAASLAIVVYATVVGGGLNYFFVAQLMVPLGQLVAMLSLGVSVGRFRPVWHWRDMGGLVRETLPLTYILLVGVLYYTIDGVMLSKLSTPEQTGAYGLAYKTIGNLSVVSTALVNVMAARFAAEAAVSSERLGGILRMSLRGVLLLAVPVATLVWPLSGELVRFVGSEEMVGIASGPMILIAVAMAVGMVSALISQAIISSFQQGVLTRLNTFNLVLNIGLNLVLIPRYGAMGAATSLVVSEVNGLLVVSVIMARRHLSFLPWGTILRLVPAVALTLAAETYLMQGLLWWVRILLVVLVWFVLVLVFRVVTVAEARQLMRRDPPVT